MNLGLVIAALLFFLAMPSHAAPVCLFGGVRCFIACGHPPALDGPILAAHYLRTDPYEKITGFDQWSALFTTPLGKCLGINGWKRYHFRVSATGKVLQAVTSWDGLRTIDLQLEEFNGGPPGCWSAYYIRAEVVRHAWKGLKHVPVAGDRIRIQGELHWDGHGFLEIHPKGSIDIVDMDSAVPESN
jgi:hypothetical protein